MLAEPKCEICGAETAAYVCRKCGKRVGPSCFVPEYWACLACAPPLKPPPKADLVTLLLLVGFAVAFVGFAVMMLGALMTSAASSGAAVVIIGPFPFAVGFGEMGWIVIPLVILALMAAIVLLLMR